MREKAVISIHAPREGGDLEACGEDEDEDDISIHAPREGGDFCKKLLG